MLSTQHVMVGAQPQLHPVEVKSSITSIHVVWGSIPVTMSTFLSHRSGATVADHCTSLAGGTVQVQVSLCVSSHAECLTCHLLPLPSLFK